MAVALCGKENGPLDSSILIHRTKLSFTRSKLIDQSGNNLVIVQLIGTDRYRTCKKKIFVTADYNISPVVIDSKEHDNRIEIGFSPSKKTHVTSG